MQQIINKAPIATATKPDTSVHMSTTPNYGVSALPIPINRAVEPSCLCISSRFGLSIYFVLEIIAMTTCAIVANFIPLVTPSCLIVVAILLCGLFGTCTRSISALKIYFYTRCVAIGCVLVIFYYLVFQNLIRDEAQSLCQQGQVKDKKGDYIRTCREQWDSIKSVTMAWVYCIFLFFTLGPAFALYLVKRQIGWLEYLRTNPQRSRI